VFVIENQRITIVIETKEISHFSLPKDIGGKFSISVFSDFR